MSQSEQLFKYLNEKKAFGYTVNDFSTLILTYHKEGNFGGGKIWQIHYKNIFVEEKFANLSILRSKIIRTLYRYPA